MNDDKPKIPEHWSDLPEEHRAAIIRRAETDIFWQNASRRFKWLGDASKVILAIAAVWFLGKEVMADWIKELQK